MTGDWRWAGGDFDFSAVQEPVLVYWKTIEWAFRAQVCQAFEWWLCLLSLLAHFLLGQWDQSPGEGHYLQ